MDVKLPVCTKDTIGMAKKKLQVSQFYNTRQFMQEDLGTSSISTF
jgi:hypothetical protein